MIDANLKKRKVSDVLLDYALYIVLGTMILAVILVDPSFVSLKNITNILSQALSLIHI